MKITIIGGGPRGLVVALYAYIKGLEVTVIDKLPIHTWKPPYILSDMIMRSPLSFDLTTGVEELKEYSLSKFLGYKEQETKTQKQLEEHSIDITRREFSGYLEYIYNTLAHLLKVKFIYEDVISIKSDKVITESYNVESDYIVIAVGGRYTKQKIPYWVNQTKLKEKVVSLVDLIRQPIREKEIGVIGSGQRAAETVYDLVNGGNKIYWCINKEQRITQYPAPSYVDWRNRSALGGYYRGLRSIEKRQEYLKQVKEWQPSITEDIAQKLQEHSNSIKIIKPETTQSIEELNRVERIISFCGQTPDIGSIPFDFDIKQAIEFEGYPELSKGFKSTSHPNISFTGVMATVFDGPRQASLVSAALTAKEIIDTAYG